MHETTILANWRLCAPNAFDEFGRDDLDFLCHSDNPIPNALREDEIYRERFACRVPSRAALDHQVSCKRRGSHILVGVYGR